MSWENIIKSYSLQKEENELLDKLSDFLQKNYPVEANYLLGEFMDKLSKLSYLDGRD